MIPSTKVIIEQKGADKDLRKGIRQSDGQMPNAFQQAKKYIVDLPLSEHPRWVSTCNFREFLIYDTNISSMLASVTKKVEESIEDFNKFLEE